MQKAEANQAICQRHTLFRECCFSVTQSCLILCPHGLQHARPPCPSPSPEVCPSSCPLHRWCLPAISFSVALFSFCPQSFPASGTFPMSWQFALGDQNTGASASVLPTSMQGWFPLRLVLSPCCPGDFQESSPVPQFEGINSLAFCRIYGPALSNCMWPLGRP